MKLTRRTLLLSPLSASLVRAEDQLSALIIDGVNNHDWQAGTRMIRGTLKASGRFTVDVSTTPPREAPSSAWNSWRPNFSAYDVVVSNFNGGHLADSIHWPKPVEEALMRYIRAGGGFVSFHAANNAFLNWPDYNEMIGLLWRDISFGPGLILDEQERVVVVPAGEGLPPGHGPRHDFVMRMVDPQHPITDGLPKEWMHPAEQLTHGQHGPANPKHGALENELRILTCSLSKDSHRREPLDWVRSWGKGRIYVTMLGHTWLNEGNPNLHCVGFQTLLARGTEWTATGKVTIPAPADFPNADAPLFRDLTKP